MKLVIFFLIYKIILEERQIYQKKDGLFMYKICSGCFRLMAGAAQTPLHLPPADGKEH